jgi:FKBP-type peptidyl-prolyl cis-trans isomerase FklB
MKNTLVLLLAMLVSIPVAAQQLQMTGEMDSVSYGMGILLGSNITKAGIGNFNEELFMQGVRDITGGKHQLLTMEQANSVLNVYLTRLNEKKALNNLAEEQKFLEENARGEGIITLPSGLQYRVISEGTGASPTDTSIVTVHYTGKFINGEVFDSSVERGEPASIPLNRVIKGWTEALKLMRPGAKWTLYIPSKLAYGESAPESIGPNRLLIFDVELISFQ